MTQSELLLSLERAARELREYAMPEYFPQFQRIIDVIDLARAEIHGREPSEEQIASAAKVIAESPLIDAPKLPAAAWMGLARHILRAAATEEKP